MINLIRKWLNRLHGETEQESSLCRLRERAETWRIDTVVVGMRDSTAELMALNPKSTYISALIEERLAAKKARNFYKADQIRQELLDRGVFIEDRVVSTVPGKAFIAGRSVEI